MNQLSAMDKIEQVLATGQLQNLTAAERVQYLNKLCELTGLNPLTKPFEFISFQGKTVPYATKGCADQLRKIHKVSIRVVEQKIENGLITVVVEATDKSGRVDSDMGVIPVGQNMRGDALANTMMKALTKAKRRVTLSICGLGLLDESEFDTMGVVAPDISMQTPSLENRPKDAERHIIKGGKYEGKHISQVQKEELDQYISEVAAMLEERNQTPPDWFEELKQQAR